MRKIYLKDAHTRQDPLRERYKVAPEEAQITDRGRTSWSLENDPFHGLVIPGSQDYGEKWGFGIHRAVGGDHDAPNPGDLLCSALASCLDSTIRIIADRLGITLTFLEVAVEADIDVRGTLVVDKTVPVGFQNMRCQVEIKTAKETDPDLTKKLLTAAEYSCVNLQTLRSGVMVEIGYSLS
ncbi:MAG: OsmC family protein [Desulfuromonadaceae bacterium]|nr:OsmC family protein [Desulfuromonadaceae bacterium]